jgi:hypothetical protein
MNNVPFFNPKPLSAVNIVVIILYAIISLGLIYYYTYTFLPNPSGILIYGIFTQLFLYMFGYKALRNFNVYFFWLIVGIIHFFFYLYLKDIPYYNAVQGGSYSKSLRNTIYLLALYQALRYLSLDLQGKEFIMPSRNGSVDLHENRKAGFADFLCFALYMAGFLTLIFL